MSSSAENRFIFAGKQLEDGQFDVRGGRTRRRVSQESQETKAPEVPRLQY
jgi:hypothetical protein